jgi:hypothetical protein
MPRKAPAGRRWLLAASILVVAGAARAEGPGVKISDSLVLHPGISLAGGYDDNAFYSSSDLVRTGVWYLTVRPAIDISTMSAQRGGSASRTLDFRFHVGAPLRFLLSSSSEITGHYSIGVDSGLQLTIFPMGEWSVDIFDNFVRTSDPPYAVVQGLFLNTQGHNIDRDNNQAGLRIRWRPGGKRFETALQYTNIFDYFEPTSPIQVKTADINDITLRLKWNFFPKTALYINASETITTYLNQGGIATPPAAYPFRIVVGLIGLITTKFEVNANVGYGNSFTQNQPAVGNFPAVQNASYSLPVGLVDLKWTPTMTTAFSLGYRHDFSQALIGTYYDLDSVWLAFNQMLWKFNLGLRAAYEHRIFHGDLSRDGIISNGRADDLIVAHAELSFPIKDYLFIGLGYDFSKNFSTCQLQGGGFCDYLRNDAWLRLSLAY